MQADPKTLSSSDFKRVGHLHVESIDDSLPALLGARYAAELYRFLAQSEREVLFLEFTGERVDSCCVVSLDPDSLYSRIARATWLSLGWHACLALRHPAFRQFLRATAQEALRAGSPTSKTPEITYIFTNQNVRGSGLGKKLVERVDHYLQNAGFSAYFVKTLDVASNRAIGFYEANGFDTIGRCREADRTFVEFQKSLRPLVSDNP